MINRPTRGTPTGVAYLDLQNLARRQHRPTDELHQIYALEGLLARLAVSPYADKLVLKGGVLLAAYDTRRPTRDVDLQGRSISNEVHEVLTVVRNIASTEIDDGLLFDAARASARNIREDDVYSGVRVSFTGELSPAKLTLHVDVSVGDPIWPAPQRIVLPRLLGGQITLAGYPLQMVHAEKIVTAIQRGVANTRWRDFADIYTLALRHDIDGDELTVAIDRVAEHRHVNLVSLQQVLDGYAAVGQTRWAAWRRKHRLDDRLPEQLDDVVTTVIRFADGVVSGTAAGATWDSAGRAWRATVDR